MEKRKRLLALLIAVSLCTSPIQCYALQIAGAVESGDVTDYSQIELIEQMSSSEAYADDYFKVRTPLTTEDKNYIYVEGKSKESIDSYCIELVKSSETPESVLRVFVKPNSTGEFSVKINTTAGNQDVPIVLDEKGTVEGQDNYDTKPGYLAVPVMSEGLYRLTVSCITTEEKKGTFADVKWEEGPLGGNYGYAWKGAVLFVDENNDNNPKLVSFPNVVNQLDENHALYEKNDETIESYEGSHVRYLDTSMKEFDYVLEEPLAEPTGETVPLTDEQISYIAEVAAEVTEGATTDYAKIKAIYQYIAGNFYYDYYGLENSKYQYCNPYYNLYALRTGYDVPNGNENKVATVCDGFSSMVIAMARSQGIPARMVNGFSLSGMGRADTWGNTTVTPKSNHWWTEAYVDGRWIVIDATRGSLNSWKRESLSDSGIWQNRNLISYSGFDISREVISGKYLVSQIERGASDEKYICYINEVNQLRNFLDYEVEGVSNGKKLNSNYDGNDFTTWGTGESKQFVTNGYGRVHQILWGGKNLSGPMDFSGFTGLKYVAVHSNDISKIELNDCHSLQYLSAVYNQLTEFSSTDSPQLAELRLQENKLINAQFWGETSLITITGEGGDFSFNYNRTDQLPLTIYAGKAPEGMVFEGIYDGDNELVSSSAEYSFKPEKDSYVVKFRDNRDERIATPIVTCTNASSGNLHLTWDAIDGAEGYDIYRSTEKDGSYQKWYTVTTTSYTSSANLGETYYFKVKAVCSDDSKSSLFSEAVGGTRILKAPNLKSIKIEEKTGKIRLEWASVDGADKYAIYCSMEEEGTYKELVTTDLLVYVDGTAIPGKTHHYKVKAIYEDNNLLNSNYSNVLSLGCKCAQPIVSSTVDESGKPVLSWQPVEGAEKYVIYYLDEQGGRKWLAETTDSSIQHKNAKPGNLYSYQVAAVTGENRFYTYSNVVEQTCVLPVTRAAVYVDDISGRPIISWETVEGADEYKIYGKWGDMEEYTSLAVSNELTYSDIQAIAGIEYSYYVTACSSENSDMESLASNVVDALCRLTVPTDIEAVTVEETGKPQIKWKAVEGADEYEIYRATDEAGDYLKIGSNSCTAFVDGAAAIGQVYYYKVRAVISGKSSAASNFSKSISCICALEMPMEVYVCDDETTNKPVIGWKAVEGADKYEIYRTDGEGEAYQMIEATTDLFVVDLTAESAETYCYKVKAIKESGDKHIESSYSEIVNIVCGLSAPVVVEALTNDMGLPEIRWEMVKGAESYNIYRGDVSDDVYNLVGTVTDLIYVDTEAIVGKTYRYKVKAIVTDGSCADSLLTDAGQARCTLPSPTGMDVYIVSDTGKPKIIWNAVVGTDSYEVHRKMGVDGTYEKILTTTQLSYTDTSALTGKTYYYRVNAVYKEDNKYNSPFGKVLSITCALPAPTGINISIEASGGKPKVIWTAVEGADRYEIHRAIGKNGTYSKVAEQAETGYTDSAAEAGKTYYYKVKAIYAGNSYANSSFSKAMNMTCDLPMPTGLKVSTSSTSGKPKLTWTAVEGAEKYEIYRSTSKNGTYTKMYTQKSTTYTNTSAVVGKTYYYKVKAIYPNNSYANSALSAASSSITCDLPAPTGINISIEASGGKPKVIWTAVEGADRYEIHRAIGKNGTYSKVAEQAETGYTDSAAEAGKTYYYKVKAIYAGNSYANSSFSKAMNMTCDLPMPTGLKVSTSSTSGKPKLIWTAVEGAEKYEIYRSTSKDGTYTKMYTQKSTTYTNTSAVVGKTYYYKVKAIYPNNSYANSALSNVSSSITCDLETPKIIETTLSAAGKPKITWATVEGADKYEIYRATAKDGTYTKMYTQKSTTYTNTSAVAGKTYYYKIKAIDADNSYANSWFSQVVCISTN